VRAAAILATTFALAAFLVRVTNIAVVLVLIDAQPLETGALARAAVVRVAAGQDVVNAALDLPAISGAADRPLAAIVVILAR
jgi:hypothetical protein